MKLLFFYDVFVLGFGDDVIIIHGLYPGATAALETL